MKRYTIFLSCVFIFFQACNSQNKEAIPWNSQTGDISGFLEVPLFKEQPNGAKIKLAYLVIPAKGQNKKADPVIFLQGGPGGSVLIAADAYRNLRFDEDRDFILFDQRGTGFSNPLCPQLNQVIAASLAKDLEIEEEHKLVLPALDACQEELVKKGQSIAAFTSAASVEDLEALRVHLGYEKWNLYGGSYGSRLGIKYMEKYPQRTKSAVLSGLFPPNIQMYEHLLSNFKRSLYLLFDACKEDPNCNRNYPELEADFLSALEGLKQDPLTFSRQGGQFTLNAQDFLLFLHQSLYDRQSMLEVPAFIKDIKERKLTSVVRKTEITLQRLQFINFASFWAVMGADEGQFDNSALLKADLAKNPEFAPGLGLFVSDPRIFKNWQSKKESQEQLRFPKIKVPTLLVSGEMDPITPPSNAEQSVQLFQTSHSISLKKEGHGAAGSCFSQIARIFINQPYEFPEVSCALNDRPLRW